MPRSKWWASLPKGILPHLYNTLWMVSAGTREGHALAREGVPSLMDTLMDKEGFRPSSGTSNMFSLEIRCMSPPAREKGSTFASPARPSIHPRRRCRNGALQDRRRWPFCRLRVRSRPIAAAGRKYARRIVNGNRDLCRINDRGPVPTSQPASIALTQTSTERGDRKHFLGCLPAPPRAKGLSLLPSERGANVIGSVCDVNDRAGGSIRSG